MHVNMYTCMKHTYMELVHVYTYVCMCAHALGFPWPLFSKNSLFVPKISYIFHKYFC